MMMRRTSVDSKFKLHVMAESVNKAVMFLFGWPNGRLGELQRWSPVLMIRNLSKLLERARSPEALHYKPMRTVQHGKCLAQDRCVGNPNIRP